MKSGPWAPGSLSGDMQVLSTLLGTLEKGGWTILLEFNTEIQRGSQVIIRLDLVLPISSLLHCGIWSNLVSMESSFHRKSSAIGCKKFG